MHTLLWAHQQQQQLHGHTFTGVQQQHGHALLLGAQQHQQQHGHTLPAAQHGQPMHKAQCCMLCGHARHAAVCGKCKKCCLSQVGSCAKHKPPSKDLINTERSVDDGYTNAHVDRREMTCTSQNLAQILFRQQQQQHQQQQQQVQLQQQQQQQLQQVQLHQQQELQQQPSWQPHLLVNKASTSAAHLVQFQGHMAQQPSHFGERVTAATTPFSQHLAGPRQIGDACVRQREAPSMNIEEQGLASGASFVNAPKPSTADLPNVTPTNEDTGKRRPHAPDNARTQPFRGLQLG
jgi:hypothetical protein